MIWLKNLLKELGKQQDDSSLFSDSQNAICLTKNPILHSRCKHIELKYHFIINLINDGDLFLLKIPGAENPADMLTKTITKTSLGFALPQLAFKKVDGEGTTLGGNVNQTPSERIVSIKVLDLVLHRL